MIDTLLSIARVVGLQVEFLERVNQGVEVGNGVKSLMYHVMAVSVR